MQYRPAAERAVLGDAWHGKLINQRYCSLVQVNASCPHQNGYETTSLPSAYSWMSWTRCVITILITHLMPLSDSQTRNYTPSPHLSVYTDIQRNAASTYNLLTEEGRTIGAALCPLRPIDPRTGGRR
jgi:hypothetical protein